MNDDQFSALADLLQLRDGPSKRAARQVLVEAMSPADAARQEGISPQSVSNAVTRCRRGLSLAARVIGS